MGRTFHDCVNHNRGRGTDDPRPAGGGLASALFLVWLRRGRARGASRRPETVLPVAAGCVRPAAAGAREQSRRSGPGSGLRAPGSGTGAAPSCPLHAGQAPASQVLLQALTSASLPASFLLFQGPCLRPAPPSCPGVSLAWVGRAPGAFPGTRRPRQLCPAAWL